MTAANIDRKLLEGTNRLKYKTARDAAVRNLSRVLGFRVKITIHPVVDMQVHSDLTLLMNQVCEYAGITQQQFKGECRKGKYVMARMLFYHMAIKELKICKAVRVALFVGARHHSTILNCMKRFQGFLDVSEKDREFLATFKGRYLV